MAVRHSRPVRWVRLGGVERTGMLVCRHGLPAVEVKLGRANEAPSPDVLSRHDAQVIAPAWLGERQKQVEQQRGQLLA